MKASINILCFGTEFYEFVFEYDVSALTWHRNRPTNEGYFYCLLLLLTGRKKAFK